MKNILYLLILSSLLLWTCKKDFNHPCDTKIEENFPIVTNDSAEIKDNEIIVKGKLGYIGNPNGDGIIQYGVVWSNTNSLPAIEKDSVRNLGNTTTIGKIEIIFKDFPEGVYYFRCFAENCAKLVYAPDVLKVEIKHSTVIELCSGSLEFVVSESLKNPGFDSYIDSGDKIYYNLCLKNNGNTDAKDVKVEIIPSNTNIVQVQDNQFSIPNLPKNGIVTYYNSGSNVPNSSTPYSFWIQMADGLDKNSLIPLTIEVESVSGKLRFLDTIRIQEPEIEISYNIVKTSIGGDTYITKGEKATYDLVIKNTGEKYAKNLSIRFDKNNNPGIEDILPITINHQGNLNEDKSITEELSIQLNDLIVDGNHKIDLDISYEPDYKITKNLYFTVGGALIEEVSENEVPDFEDTDGNNLINQGEEVILLLKLKNTGGVSAQNIKVDLLDSMSNIQQLENDIIPILDTGKISDNYKLKLKIHDAHNVGEQTIPIEISVGTSTINKFKDKIKVHIYPKDIPNISTCMDPSHFIVIKDDNGNNDKIVNPGEEINYQFALSNTGTKDASNVSYDIISSTPGVDIINAKEKIVSSVPKGGTCVDGQFKFIVSDYKLAGTEAEIVIKDLNCTDCPSKVSKSFKIPIGNIICPDLTISSFNASNLSYNKSSNIIFNIENNSNFNAQDITLEISSNHDKIDFQNAVISNINVNAKETSSDLTFVADVGNVLSDTTVDFTIKITSFDQACTKTETKTDISVSGKITATDGLLAYYTFDDDNADDIYGGHHGTNNNNVEYFSEIRTNNSTDKSAFFDGTNHIRTTGFYHNNRNSLSVNFWINSYIQQNQTILSTGGIYDYGLYDLSILNGMIDFDRNPLCSAEEVLDGQWHMVTITIDKVGTSSLVEVYFDDNRNPSFSENKDIDLTNQSLRIGSNYDKTDPNNFFGYLDDIRIYNKVISNTERNNIYDVEKPSNDIQYNITENKGLVAYYPFDENTNNAITNYVPKFNITNVSNVSFIQNNTIKKSEGKSVFFESNSYMDANKLYLDGLSKLGINLWIKGNMQENQTLLSTGGIYDYGTYDLSIINGMIDFDRNPLCSAESILDGQWHMITINIEKVGTSGSVEVFFDNDINPMFSENIDIDITDNSLRIGANYDNTPNYMYGYLDNIRIYNRTISNSSRNNIFLSEGPPDILDYKVGVSNGLVAYYPFNGKNAQNYLNNYELDFNGNPNAVDFRNYQKSSSDNAAFFDGNSAYINVQKLYMNKLDALTTTFWINSSEKNSSQTILSTGGIYTYGSYDLSIINGMIDFDRNPLCSAASILDGTWHMVSVTVEKLGISSLVEVYFDNESNPRFSQKIDIDITDKSLRIGSNYDNTPNYFHGYMDNIRIYNRVLKESEINEIYLEEK